MGRIYVTEKSKDLRDRLKNTPNLDPPCLRSQALIFFCLGSEQTRESYLRTFKPESLHRDLASIVVDELIEEGLLEER